MIFEMLDTGEQNARTAKELARIIGTDRRSISLLVESERRAGKPICASCDSKTPQAVTAPGGRNLQNPRSLH